MTTDLREFTGLVKFTAKWCAPCKAADPIIKKVATDHNVDLVTIDIDDEPNIASEFGVRSVPTLMTFKNGVPVRLIVGSVSEEKYIDLVTESGLTNGR